MKHFFTIAAVAAAGLLSLSCAKSDFTVSEKQPYAFRGDYRNFMLTGEFCADSGAVATIAFHDDGTGSGYKVLLHGGPIDGTIKSGSLLHVRNLYRALEDEATWTPMEIAVMGKNISVKINVVPDLTASKQTKHKQYPCYQSKYLFFHISQTTHTASSSFQNFISINTHINSIIFSEPRQLLQRYQRSSKRPSL